VVKKFILKDNASKLHDVTVPSAERTDTSILTACLRTDVPIVIGLDILPNNVLLKTICLSRWKIPSRVPLLIVSSVIKVDIPLNIVLRHLAALLE